MPKTLTYPGVYIEEVPSGVRTITGVATSVTAFIGRAKKGPVDDPVRINSFGEFQRRFGGLWRDSMMSYAVSHYFSAGGTDAVIVRVAESSALESRYGLAAGAETFTISADNDGVWGDLLQITVDDDVAEPTDTNMFNLTINETDENGNVITNEIFRNVSMETDSPRYVVTVLDQQSKLVSAVTPLPAARPDVSAVDASGNPVPASVSVNGLDGVDVGFDEIADSSLEATRSGIWALRDADIFNMMCIPPFTSITDVDGQTWDAARQFCSDERAMLIVDPPSNWSDPENVLDSSIGVDGSSAELPTRDKNAVIYFPRVKAADPLQDNQLATFAPCGLIAGIYARTDAARGVWKAPAGQEATLSGIRQLGYTLTDDEVGRLNPKGVNCLKTFPNTGPVVWGARTLKGADALASEWKYIPVRRIALYIEESLFRGTQWVIFEPNDNPLWSQIRLNVGSFMHNLFRQGAFQGSSPKEAYFVKCDSETTTQNDIDRGIVNLEVGFAPLKPAEFLVIKISQIAGQLDV